MANLDVKIQEISLKLAEILEENEVNKLLGVLSIDGVYAMWLFALDKLDKRKKDFADVMIEILILVRKNIKNDYHREWDNELTKLKSEKKQKEKEYDDNNCKEKKNDEKCKKIKEDLNNIVEKIKKIITDVINELSSNLTDLLFLKDILERILIYARYHLKAM